MTSRRAVVVDGLLVVGFAALSLSLVVAVAETAGDVLRFGGVVVAHLWPLVFRRGHPHRVLLAMAAAGLVSVPLGVPVVVLGPAILVAVYTVGTRSAPERARRLLLPVALLMSGVILANGMDVGTVGTNLAAFGIAWWLGDRARLADLQAEAQRAAAVEAARQAATAERARIARELHDVVAHALSVITVQAGTGRFVIDDAADVAKASLANIEETSRAAMQEMRRLLSVLRAEDEVVGPAGVGDLTPAPGIDDVPALVAGTEHLGLQVDLQVEGAPRPLPAGVGLCAYRIVQEALTNVGRHARATAARVTVRYADDSVAVEVVDDGVGAAGLSSDGHGLVGMRERADLYGGEFEAGTVPGGGYRVRARIPLGTGP